MRSNALRAVVLSSVLALSLAGCATVSRQPGVTNEAPFFAIASINVPYPHSAPFRIARVDGAPQTGEWVTSYNLRPGWRGIDVEPRATPGRPIHVTFHAEADHVYTVELHQFWLRRVPTPIGTHGAVVPVYTVLDAPDPADPNQRSAFAVSLRDADSGLPATIRPDRHTVVFHVDPSAATDARHVILPPQAPLLSGVTTYPLRAAPLKSTPLKSTGSTAAKAQQATVGFKLDATDMPCWDCSWITNRDD